MKPNIGLMNAFCRMTAGFTMMSWATAKLVNRPYKQSYLMVALLGAMKVAEGHTRYCPVTDLLTPNEKLDDDQTTLEKVINPS
ncbi:YgaP family membrane protein [Pseudalkalibacillus caeni]|uniref:DUF2892 domain-containing protein n=1 Tax=Exobacillus caeni TaxID=2574798 RepID=A0A5R9EV93_9BACL|nr:DUF2892 domain-containing protein [Pseudalkalibacillus caeni]TLS34977.1 DUF2892 domain-containing protein [Pseudalkalibacillus caeni]